MVKIKTFVIIDLETTGLPHQEYNRTKITEMCLLAVTRQDIKDTATGNLPPMSKLSFLLNPEKYITPASARITGITNSRVKNTLTFKEKIKTLNAFLQDLTKPVCLVAHNGNIFDYKILLTECIDAKVSLPHDLLCVDSLSLFRKIAKRTPPERRSDSPNKRASINNTLPSHMTDDEDEWRSSNESQEEWQEIDELCNYFSSMSPSKSPQKLNKIRAKVSDGKKRLSMKLSDIYRRYFGGMNGMTAHRAEDDCLMLLQCMVAEQVDFLKLSDSNCKLFTDCKPLERKVPTFF